MSYLDVLDKFLHGSIAGEDAMKNNDRPIGGDAACSKVRGQLTGICNAYAIHSYLDGTERPVTVQTGQSAADSPSPFDQLKRSRVA